MMHLKTGKNKYDLYKVLSFRCNAFVLTNGSQNLLIDCGSARFRRQLIWGLAKRGIRHLDALILTHSHFDHCGNSHYIKNRFNTQVYIHESEAEFLSSGKSPLPKGSTGFTRMLVNSLGGRIPSWACYQPCGPDILVHEKYPLDHLGFNAYLLPTPGHSPGSMSLIIDEEIAITGDAMFGIFPGSIYPPFADDLTLMIQSWKTLLDSNADLFLPSHGQHRTRATVLKEFAKYTRY